MMILHATFKVSTVLLLVCVVSISGQARCRICNSARSLDDCTKSVTCAPDEECYMDEIVTEQLTIEYTAGCRARDVCASASSSGITIGRRGIIKRAGFVACSRCCDTAPTDGKECNAKLCGIKLLNQGSSQCYICDSTKDGAQGDVSTPTQCGTLGTCQTDEVCGAQTFALANNVTHRKTCLQKRVCTLLTQKALEDIQRCKDPVKVAAGECGNRKRSGQMVCTACCGDAVCNGDSCDDVLDRLYNLWVNHVLNFTTLKTTGPLPTTPVATAPSTMSTTPKTVSTIKLTAPTTKITMSSTTKTVPSTPVTKIVPPTTTITHSTTAKTITKATRAPTPPPSTGTPSTTKITMSSTTITVPSTPVPPTTNIIHSTTTKAVTKATRAPTPPPSTGTSKQPATTSPPISSGTNPSPAAVTAG